MAALVALNVMFIPLGFSFVTATILADVEREHLDVGALTFFDDKGIQTL
jgi:hypothetical protein